jgi:PAS domain S-box-containing protein
MSAENVSCGEAGRRAALMELDLLRGESFPDLDRLTALAADITGANISAFTVHDAAKAYQISTSYGLRETMLASDCLCSVTFDKGATAVLDDAQADPVASRYRHVATDPFVRSYAGAPIAIEGGPIVGVLAVGHTEPGRFGARETALLERAAELVCVFLTQRRAAIQAQRAAATTEQERERQHLFEMIFEAIREGVNVHTPQGQVVEANPACLEILGLTADQMAGRADTDPRWRTFRPDGSPFPVNEYPVEITLKTGRPMNDVPMGVQLPSGEIRWISINSVALRDSATNKVQHAVVTMKDITRQKDAEDEIVAQNVRLGKALAEAEKASRAKSDFMGVMSHELRTPMNAVLGCAKILANTRLDPVQRRTLGVLEDAGRQMLALLNDLLDLSSLNADKMRIKREPVSLVRLIEDAAVIWASEVQAKGLSLSVMIDPKLIPPRNVDPARLLQIIGNLMGNAIKFTARGDVTIQAWPEKGGDGSDRVAIEVEDTGPGVPEEAAGRIFSAFEQADASTTRKHGGLGLGLHVARRLAVAMGGDIELDTEIGRGSRFTVRFDAPLATQEEQAEARRGSGAGEGAELVPKDILCVDDNPRNLYVICEILRAAGHTAIEAGSGEEALELLASRKFDVVLLDMVMPGMDGISVLSRLREAGGVNRETPVIACTANVLPDQVDAYLNAGTVGVLAKPIDVREMLMAVAAAA